VDQSRGRLLLGLVLLAVGALVFGIPSYGDTYSLYAFANPYFDYFYGIDNVGNFVINVTNDYIDQPVTCAGVVNPSSCYETYYVRTNQTILSVTPPSLHYDDGFGCTPSIPDFIVFGGVCNNGHEIFGAVYVSGGFVENGVWTGPYVYLGGGTFRGGFMNHLGDAVFIDDRDQTLEWAEDLTTSVSPEPGSLFLVGSGALLLVACLIRRSYEKGRQTRRFLYASS
jgi:hypothetical protein